MLKYIDMKTDVTLNHSSVQLLILLLQLSPVLTSYAIGFLLHPEFMGDSDCHQASNFWPTLSTLQSDWLLARYITRMCVTPVLLLRAINVVVHFQYFSHLPARRHATWCRIVNVVHAACHFAVLIFIYSFTFISYNESVFGHLIGWLGFMLSSLAQMISFLILYTFSGLMPEVKSRCNSVMRLIMFLTHIVSISLFFYFGYQHQTECQPNSHSYAAITEFLIIASHVLFHYADCIDLQKLSCSLVK